MWRRSGCWVGREKIVKRVKRRGLTNVRVLRLESSYFLEWMCPAESVARVHIMFPDPWPKRRHHKNRLIQESFLVTLHKVLAVGGEVRFTTDHAEYFEWAQELWLKRSDLFEKRGAWDATGDPPTDFERHFQQEGRLFHRCAWGKK
ncbi:MAG: hypothetical protein HC904_15625 [Blastochloris sp.]|nr:hypothetical protein [Blastochloris sp.]